jgi:hypothetical protein
VKLIMRIRASWAHQDLNLGPTDYESAALTAELWARAAPAATAGNPWGWRRWEMGRTLGRAAATALLNY